MVKSEKLNYATRQALGNLFRAVTLSTDPAHTLAFSSSLITTTRAALIQKLEERIPDSEMLPGIFNGILKAIVVGISDSNVPGTAAEIKTLDDRINQIFKSESMARYGLEIFRDALITEGLHREWKRANKIYIQSPAAWAMSNAILSDIHFHEHEILVRHDLMQFPKGEMFNLDETDSTAAIMGRVMDAMRKEEVES